MKWYIGWFGLALVLLLGCSSNRSTKISGDNQNYKPETEEFLLAVEGQELTELNLDTIESVHAIRLSEGAMLEKTDGKIQNCRIPGYTPSIDESSLQFDSNLRKLRLPSSLKFHCVYIEGKQNGVLKNISIYVESKTEHFLDQYNGLRKDFDDLADSDKRTAFITALQNTTNEKVQLEDAGSNGSRLLKVGNTPILLDQESHSADEATQDILKSYHKVGAEEIGMPKTDVPSFAQQWSFQNSQDGNTEEGRSLYPRPSSIQDSLGWTKGIVFSARPAFEEQMRDMTMYAFGSIGGKWTWPNSQIDTDKPFPLFERPSNYYTGLLSQLDVFESFGNPMYGKAILFTSDQPGLSSYRELHGTDLLSRPSSGPGDFMAAFEDFLDAGLEYNLGIRWVIFDGRNENVEIPRHIVEGDIHTSVENDSDLIVNNRISGDDDYIYAAEHITYVPIANFPKEIALDQIEQMRNWARNIATNENDIFNALEQFLEKELGGDFQSFQGDSTAEICGKDSRGYSNLRINPLEEPATPLGSQYSIREVFRTFYDLFCGDKKGVIKNISLALTHPELLITGRREADESITILWAADSFSGYITRDSFEQNGGGGCSDDGSSIYSDFKGGVGLGLSPMSIYLILSAYQRGLFKSDTSLSESFMDKEAEIIRTREDKDHHPEVFKGASEAVEISKFAAQIHGHSSGGESADAAIFERKTLDRTQLDETTFDPGQDDLGVYERIDEGDTRRSKLKPGSDQAIYWDWSRDSLIKRKRVPQLTVANWDQINFVREEGSLIKYAAEGNCRSFNLHSPVPIETDHLYGGELIGDWPGEKHQNTCPAVDWKLKIHDCEAVFQKNPTRTNAFCNGPQGKGCDFVDYDHEPVAELIEYPLIDAHSQCLCHYEANVDGEIITDSDPRPCVTETETINPLNTEPFGSVRMDSKLYCERNLPEGEYTDFCGYLFKGSCPTGKYYIGGLANIQDLCDAKGDGEIPSWQEQFRDNYGEWYFGKDPYSSWSDEILTTDDFYRVYHDSFENIELTTYSLYHPDQVWSIRKEFLANYNGQLEPGDEGYRDFERLKAFLDLMARRMQGSQYDELFKLPVINSLPFYNSSRLVESSPVASSVSSTGGHDQNPRAVDALAAPFRTVFGRNVGSSGENDGPLYEDRLYGLIFDESRPARYWSDTIKSAFVYDTVHHIPQSSLFSGGASNREEYSKVSVPDPLRLAMNIGTMKDTPTQRILAPFNEAASWLYSLSANFFDRLSGEYQTKESSSSKRVTDSLRTSAWNVGQDQSQVPLYTQPENSFLSFTKPSGLNPIISNRWAMATSHAWVGDKPGQEWQYENGGFCYIEGYDYEMKMNSPKNGAKIYSYGTFNGQVSAMRSTLEGDVTFSGDRHLETVSNEAGQFSGTIDFTSLRDGPINLNIQFENQWGGKSDPLLWYGEKVSGCRSAQDCPSGSACLNGQCKYDGCNNDSQCRPSESCGDDGKCHSDGSSDHCDSDSDCDEGSGCIGGFCIEIGCKNDLECSNGRGSCVDGQCEAPTTCMPVDFGANCEELYGDGWDYHLDLNEFGQPQAYCCEGDPGNGKIESCNPPSGSPCNIELGHGCLPGNVCVPDGSGWGHCYAECDSNTQCGGGSECTGDIENGSVCCSTVIPLPGPPTCSHGNTGGSNQGFRGSSGGWDYGEGKGICPNDTTKINMGRY